jgi:hypothetical protein
MSNRLLQARWPWFTAAALLALVYLATLVETGPADPRPVGSPPTSSGRRSASDLEAVLFILIDTLRADRCPIWGYLRETSLTIDWLMRAASVSRASSQSS